MFGEISVMTWLGAAIMLAIGGGAGFFVARQIKDKRTLELEQKLEATQSKLNDYQEDVNRHFLKTSLLFSKLTDNYRDVYEHLATGAQKLCNDKPHISALDLPDTKILSATVASAAATADERPTSKEGANFPSKKTEHDDTAHLGVESIVATDDSAATTTEAIPADDENQSEQIIADQSAAEPLVTETIETTNLDNIILKTEPVEDRPSISAEELKTLEANERKKAEEEDVHLGAESTPGVELEHHKTHPSIH